MTASATSTRKFSVSEYVQMIAAGIFADDDHLELVDGDIVTVAPQGPEHSTLEDELRDRLTEAYRGLDVFLRDQNPLRAGDRGVPEPDLAVVRGKPRDYLAAFPSRISLSDEDTLTLPELDTTWHVASLLP